MFLKDTQCYSYECFWKIPNAIPTNVFERYPMLFLRMFLQDTQCYSYECFWKIPNAIPTNVFERYPMLFLRMFLKDTQCYSYECFRGWYTDTRAFIQKWHNAVHAIICLLHYCFFLSGDKNKEPSPPVRLIISYLNISFSVLLLYSMKMLQST